MQENPQNSRKFHPMFPWFIWLLGAAFYFYENLIQVSPGVIADNLIQDFAISSTVLGTSMGFFYYSYTPMQIPVGVLVDNYNLRYLLTMATLSVVAGCLIFAYAPNAASIAAGRFLIGFGAAFAAVCAMKIAALWFPPNRFPMLVGFMVTLGMLGSMTGEQPLAYMVEYAGWRNALLMLAAVGLLLACLIVYFVRHSPDHMSYHALKIQRDSEHSEFLLHGLMQVIKSKQSWIVAIYGGLLFASTSIFGGLWGVPYFMTAYQMDKPTAAGLVSMLFLGWVFGAPLSGFLVNWLRSHKKVLWLSSIGSLLTMSVTLYVNGLSLLQLQLLMGGFGFFSSLFLPSFTLMRLIHTRHNAGAALGFMNAANMLGGAFGQPLVGILLDMSYSKGAAVTQTVTQHGDRIYSALNYQYALSTLPILIACSFLLLPFIKEQSANTHER
ncbi:MAG: MFS transporter [Legionellaceae bacterium]|nr:MFS transporter [Legionellaceae bacterium]